MRVLSVFLFGLVLCATGTFAQAQTAAYDTLQRELKPTLVDSVKGYQSNLRALDGSVVEMSGEIAGVMSREGSRIVLLRMVDGTLLLNAPTDATLPALRTGILVKVLARVNAHDDTPLSVLAAAEAPRTHAPTATIQEHAAIVPVAATASTAVPEITAAEVALPQPPKILAPTPKATPRPQPKPLASRGTGVLRPALPKKASTTASAALPAYEADQLVESQKPAYEALARRHNKKLRPEVVTEIAEALLRAGYKYNMDPRFLAAIIAVESDFNVNCLSSSGAMGLGQLMPFNLRPAGVKNPWNPTENIFGCAKLLRGHLNDYKSRPNGTLLAVAAYNAGPGAVRRAGYRVPGGQQVQRYVWKVYYRYKAFAPDMFK